jgi:LDH2 family malate/lactate/ureidoglycolate dehydrogenase
MPNHEQTHTDLDAEIGGNTGVRIDPDALSGFMAAVLTRAGMLPDQAATASQVLTYASLRGVDTHGIRNLRPIYVAEIEERRANLRPHYTIEHETPISARVNGDASNGLVAGAWAMALAIEKAKQQGIGMVAMHNSRHCGAVGYYTWQAAQQDLIGIAMTGRFYARERNYGVPPLYGAMAKFSTNPLAIAFPTQNEPIWNFDMATSVVPFNRVWMMRDNNENLPLGWGVDEQMQPTTDPDKAVLVLPLGGDREQGGHKGYGLSMMVATLCNVLSSGWSQLHEDDPEAFDGYKMTGDGHFFAAMRVDLFRPLDDFKRAMDAMIRSLHQAPKAPGCDRIYVAGEIEHETALQRRSQGIPLSAAMVNDMRILAAKYAIALPFD